jgi:multidrug efflux pump subunit AcrB
VGPPISLQFKAETFQELKALEAMAREEIAKVPGIIDVDTDLEPGKKELHVVVNDAAAAEAGVSAADIAMAVRASFDGQIATVIRKLDEEVDVKVLFPEADRKRGAGALADVRVPNRRGYLIPLRSLASIREDVGFTSIKHDGGQRIVTITANVEENTGTSVAANQALQPLIAARMKEFPRATVSYTGEFEDTQESMIRLAKSFGVAAGAIFLILATTFGSSTSHMTENWTVRLRGRVFYNPLRLVFAMMRFAVVVATTIYGYVSRPALVMLSIPIAGCGVIFAFALHGQPLGFMMIMGSVALAGVVVNNSIVLVQFAVRGIRDEGLEVGEAILEAARIRLRPMMLTSVTTLVGLLPTAYGWGGDDPFVRPMALSLSWGVAFSLMMTVLAMPSTILIFEGDFVKVFGFVWKAVDWAERAVFGDEPPAAPSVPAEEKPHLGAVG